MILNQENKRRPVLEAVLIAAGTALVNFIFEEFKEYRKKHQKVSDVKDKQQDTSGDSK